MARLTTACWATAKLTTRGRENDIFRAGAGLAGRINAVGDAFTSP